VEQQSNRKEEDGKKENTWSNAKEELYKNTLPNNRSCPSPTRWKTRDLLNGKGRKEGKNLENVAFFLDKAE